MDRKERRIQAVQRGFYESGMNEDRIPTSVEISSALRALDEFDRENPADPADTPFEV